jgi:hypothetical protein
MEKVILLLGNFTFHHFEEEELALFKEDKERKALIHEIHEVRVCDTYDEACEIGDEAESYIIPLAFLSRGKYDNAEIVYEQIIDEETNIGFEKYTDLSWMDTAGDNIILFIKGLEAGEMKVWLDSEMDNREYLTINHEIVYLDTLEEFVI